AKSEVEEKSLSKTYIERVENGSVVSPKRFFSSGVYSGVKRKRNDLGVIYSKQPAEAAAVYTLNLIQAAPLEVTKKAIAKQNTLQAIVVNSGNANACTGEQGLKDAYLMQKEISKHLHIPSHYAAVASTGIIGLDMPMDKILANIHQLEV